jgi:hypothetical protein
MTSTGVVVGTTDNVAADCRHPDSRWRPPDPAAVRSSTSGRRRCRTLLGWSATWGAPFGNSDAAAAQRGKQRAGVGLVLELVQRVEDPVDLAVVGGEQELVP